MVYGMDTVGKVALGLAGVVVLSASANSVVILAEAVRRAARQFYNWATSAVPDTKAKDEWKLRDFTPYSRVETWQALAVAGLKNVIVGTAALYVANRFCPSLAISANSLLSYAVPIHFTPSHIPLTRLAGL